MSAYHSDCRYANREDRVPVTGIRFITKKLSLTVATRNTLSTEVSLMANQFIGDDGAHTEHILFKSAHLHFYIFTVIRSTSLNVCGLIS